MLPPPTALLHDPRFRRRWRALLLLLTAITSWFAFMPSPAGPGLPQADKVNHLLAFGALAGTAAFAWAPSWRTTMRTAAGLLLYGGFIEVVQSTLPTRQASWADLLADAAGIAAGLMVAQWLRRRWPDVVD
jgi:VanZ family protein